MKHHATSIEDLRILNDPFPCETVINLFNEQLFSQNMMKLPHTSLQTFSFILFFFLNHDF